MKVLLTGASGFVGSHILDRLTSQGIPTTVLLRAGSSRRFLVQHASTLEVREGSILQPAGLPGALSGVTHVIHCAGLTRACRPAEFEATNHTGTRNLVEAVNAAAPGLERLVHISSLAVTGPATPENPAREEDQPKPISDYGRSKLAGEREVRNHCRVPFTVLRPPAVYGPRDLGFLSMFKAVKSHVLPRTNAAQVLSLVFVRDLANAVVGALTHPGAAGQTYFVAASELVTARRMAEEIASQMGGWTVPCPVPSWVLWPICLGAELNARVTGQARLLNLQKYAELRAPGWVCDASRLGRELGLECATTLRQGIAETLSWYRKEKWL